ncbi:MAG: c-type cytochrome [Fuerstiella sp.]|nr:c-type cytochrome [Fuerstiella sp.]
MLPDRSQYRLSIATVLCVTTTTILTLSSVPAVQEDDEDFPPGLLAKYAVGEHTIERVDKSVNFNWGAAAPDQRLPRGRFTAQWSGNVLARLPGTHRFHVFLAGDVKIAIDGETVLNASEQWGFASGRTIDLTAGDHKIAVSYSTPHKSDKPRARLSVFWSSDKFTLEPLPADVLYRDEPSTSWISARGRHVADALRCAACHQNNSGLVTIKAPALDRVKGSQSKETLVQRLMNPRTVVANSHMPDFRLSRSEATSAAAFLLSISKDAQKQNGIKLKEDDVAAGTKLLNSRGCAACHRLADGPDGGVPLAEPYEGPDLVKVGQRRTPEWIDRWLKDPASLNIDHRMPVFALSNDERRQLVAVLTGNAPAVQSETSLTNDGAAEQIAAGKKLVTSANCAGCHTIPGLKSSSATPLTERSTRQDADHCVRSHDTDAPNQRQGQRLPFFPMTDNKADAVLHWFSTMEHDTGLSSSDQGELLLKRNACIACHDRNAERGLSSIAADLQKAHPDLKGQSQGLVPPPLTAVGDKLTDDYLRKAVAGEQKERRLPWLFVRMPKFRHSDAERAAIVDHLITADRVPDEADGVRSDVLAHIDLTGGTKATADDLLLGNQLTGAGGFNCVACHSAGPFEPRNVALGTRGSDIMSMGDRIRPRFFQRWMKNPIRVVAGIEMPAIKKAMPDVLDGSLPKQIGTIWKALNDHRFTPPTVTSRFEQVVNVKFGSLPRIIRDVFTIGLNKDRQAVARAMAIGFGNGHNVLIDLDTMQLRLWTIGEFARQRTEGKSWYWDMPGTVVQRPQKKTFARQLVSLTDGRTFNAVIDEDRAAELVSYRILPEGVELICRSWFDTSGKTASTASEEPHFAITGWTDPSRPLLSVTTQETFEQYSYGNTGTGWRRTLKVLECPPEFALAATPETLLQSDLSAIDVVRSSGTSDDSSPGLVTQGQQTFVTVITDLRPPSVATLKSRPIVSAAIEQVTTTPGLTGSRVPIDMSIMPTAMTWLPDGRMAFTSLKGHVWIAEDTDDDGLPDRTTLFEEGLAAPFGILADVDSIIVGHKPEILRLRDTDGDGRADVREIVASGWGYNDNYHDWTSGLIRDPEGNMYTGLGSDYSQKGRPQSQDRWRGGVIKIDPSGIVTPLGMSMRYPMGLAIDSHGNLFATDNQGVQNTFNEINHILPGRHYGVPSVNQPTDDLAPEIPALMVPHPWTRSVNSILFLPEDYAVPGLRGHGIGCEYDSRFLIRFTVQNVNGVLQGASYRFSLPDQEAGGSNFVGPICSAVAPDGAIFIGSIWDSGWEGGRNTGGITRLVPSADGLPNGIQELTATPTAFEVEFFRPVNEAAASKAASWSVQGYTREWGGSYATPDSGRYTLSTEEIEVLEGGKRVRLTLKNFKPGYVYDVSVTGPLTESAKLWPSEAHYSMKVVPQ